MNARDKALVRTALQARVSAAIDRNFRQPDRFRGAIPYALQDADEYLRGISIHPENAERGREVCEALLHAIKHGQDPLTCRLVAGPHDHRKAA
jgi:hypothetical protein